MQPKGLVFDLETSPLVAYVWDRFPNDGVIDVIEDRQILSVAWQWVGEKKVHVIGQDDFKGYRGGVNNDLEVVRKLRELLDMADYIVAHNGDAFDIKIANARMMVHNLTPPSPYKQIDTKKIAKRVGGFTSNRLKHLAESLSVAQKGDPGGFGTWKGCLAGDPKAWKKLKTYNKQDIPPLMDLYLKFRAWDKQGLAMNTAMERPGACPHCGEGPMKAGMLYHSTKTGKYQYFRCGNCGGSAKSRTPVFKQATDRNRFVAA